MGLNRARIAVDAMGGDYAPSEIVAGAIRAGAELDVDIALVGDVQQIQGFCSQPEQFKASKLLRQRAILRCMKSP
jgi:glycerol-3-phosphate acyltransferase PlsX